MSSSWPNVLDRHGEEFFRRIVIAAHGCLVYSQEGKRFEIVDPHRKWITLKQEPVTFFRITQRLFSRLALGHFAFKLPVGSGKLRGALDHVAFQVLRSRFSLSAVRSAMSHISRTLRFMAIRRKVSSKRTQPACSSQRHSLACEYSIDRLGQNNPRKKWSAATTIVAGTSTRQSR